MKTSSTVDKLIILIALMPFLSFSQQQHLPHEKKKNKTFFNHLILDFSASHVGLTSKLNETQFTNRELIFNKKLNQGIQYSVNLYYELGDQFLMGFRYSLMEGNRENAKLFYDGFLTAISAHKKIHFLGPTIAYRKFLNYLNLSYEVSYSMGFTSSIRINSVQSSNIKYTANTFGSELGLAIYYKITEHLALGFNTGINVGSYKEYRIESPNGVSYEKFDEGHSSLNRGYYGLSLRIKK